ncbi:hypothetical protein D9611_015093 [Ephemerocybe angulata]|uniref:Uncharacterized protein n=1 Tax=Ephemerocybe angulata TaxID=980116 RepID=A0A8H5APP9_9AGAR|nr:hypothetical protein D9611_015093 [Tulosesus angulatus]
MSAQYELRQRIKDAIEPYIERTAFDDFIEYLPQTKATNLNITTSFGMEGVMRSFLALAGISVESSSSLRTT